MKTDDKNYKYLLRLYSLVDECLASASEGQNNLAEVVVAFCIVTEKLFKLRLHGKNPVLVYEGSRLKDDDSLVSVIKEKELSVETIRIRETLNRYKLMFQDEFSDGEMQVLSDIYNARNHFVHGYKSDDDILSDSDNILKKMGTVWSKISVQAVSIFGKDLIKANKPKKKYSEEELEKVLTEEVRTKIKSIKSEYGMYALNNDMYSMSNYMSAFGLTGEKCPRCGSYEFSLDETSPNMDALLVTRIYSQRINFSDLYKCKKCGLELTKKEYAIAKKLKP